MSGFALDLFSDYGHVLKDTAPETWIDPGIEGVPLQVKNPSIYFQVCLPKCAFSILWNTCSNVSLGISLTPFGSQQIWDRNWLRVEAF